MYKLRETYNSKLESSNIIVNAERVSGGRRFCKLQGEGQSLMQAAMSQLNLSARAYHWVLKKFARTPHQALRRKVLFHS